MRTTTEGLNIEMKLRACERNQVSRGESVRGSERGPFMNQPLNMAEVCEVIIAVEILCGV